MEKKKIIWITGALATTGLVAYSFLHKCDGECFFCRYSRSVNVISLGGVALLSYYFNTCLRS